MAATEDRKNATLGTTLPLVIANRSKTKWHVCIFS